MYKKEIVEIKTIQKKLNKYKDKWQKEIDTRTKKLDKQMTLYIQKKWDKTFTGISVHFILDFHKPEVYFYSVNDLELYGGEFYKMGRRYSKLKAEKVDAPIPFEKLKDFIKQINEELGISCNVEDKGSIFKDTIENSQK